jgi:hypothetical protein
MHGDIDPNPLVGDEPLHFGQMLGLQLLTLGRGEL